MYLIRLQTVDLSESELRMLQQLGTVDLRLALYHSQLMKLENASQSVYTYIKQLAVMQ